MSKKCRPEDMGDLIAQQLQLYCADTQYMITAAVDKRADELVKALKSDSPERTGKYAKDWRSKVITNDFSYYNRKVYNKDHYRLTNLLEYGHVKRGGGRTSPQPHIAKNEERILKEFEKDVLSALREGGGLRSRR